VAPAPVNCASVIVTGVAENASPVFATVMAPTLHPVMLIGAGQVINGIVLSGAFGTLTVRGFGILQYPPEVKLPLTFNVYVFAANPLKVVGEVKVTHGPAFKEYSREIAEGVVVLESMIDPLDTPQFAGVVVAEALT